MVVPFMEASGLTFTAVKDSDGSIQKAYDVSASPSNVLIDAEGRVVARPDLLSAEQERGVAALIELLLQKPGGKQGEQ